MVEISPLRLKAIKAQQSSFFKRVFVPFFLALRLLKWLIIPSKPQKVVYVAGLVRLYNYSPM